MPKRVCLLVLVWHLFISLTSSHIQLLSGWSLFYHIDLTCILNRFGGFLISKEILLAGDVLAVFFAVIIGAFSLGQAGPNAESLVTAAGAAGEVFEIIDKVMVLKNIMIYYVVLI